MNIRNYLPEDAEHIANIFVRAVTGLGSRCYEDTQVAAWASRVTTVEDTDARCRDGRTVWVGVDDSDTPVAFIDLEANGHIDMMFCVPEWAGRGMASALYRRLEPYAVNRGVARLHTEASEVAKPVFGHWGFRLLHRNDLEIDGVAIHNYTMEKAL